MDEAHALADRLVRAAPLAARATKEVAVRAAHMTTVEAIRFGETMRRVAGATEDAAEGGAPRAKAARRAGAVAEPTLRADPTTGRDRATGGPRRGIGSIDRTKRSA